GAERPPASADASRRRLRSGLVTERPADRVSAGAVGREARRGVRDERRRKRSEPGNTVGAARRSTGLVAGRPADPLLLELGRAGECVLEPLCDQPEGNAAETADARARRQGPTPLRNVLAGREVDHVRPNAAAG